MDALPLVCVELTGKMLCNLRPFNGYDYFIEQIKIKKYVVDS